MPTINKLTKSLAMVSAMNTFNGHKPLEGFPIPKKTRAKRAKELHPRNQPEREFRHSAIKWLRSKGCIVYRIENSIAGKSTGIPDLLIFTTNKMIWIELKSLTGRLSSEQIFFRQNCQASNIGFHIAQTIKDLEIIIGIDNKT